MNNKVKLSKEEIKGPDQFMVFAHNLATFYQKNKTTVLLATVAVLVIAIGFVSYTYIKEKWETESQMAYYQVEKEYNKVRTELATKPASEVNFEKDYSPLATKYQNFIEKNLSSQAARMAVLNLAEIYNEFGKNELAVEWLSKLAKKVDDGVLSAFVISQLGSAKANLKDCEGAAVELKKIINNNKWTFMHADSYLKMGLCYESINDLAKAEENYKKVTEVGATSSAAKTANKYLRMLSIKKAQVENKG